MPHVGVAAAVGLLVMLEPTDELVAVTCSLLVEESVVEMVSETEVLVLETSELEDAESAELVAGSVTVGEKVALPWSELMVADPDSSDELALVTILSPSTELALLVVEPMSELELVTEISALELVLVDTVDGVELGRDTSICSRTSRWLPSLRPAYNSKP